ncbi:MAG: hypothetical protein HRT77_10015, partial [Halioglobus sp.]|nr:hypothetical protein [Halioglobus sp.]
MWGKLMYIRIAKPIITALLVIGVLIMGSISMALADDTEIYKNTLDNTDGERPKVLIVFDDSGSMGRLVDLQKPPYDPDASYDGGIPDGRIYWRIDGDPNIPGSDSSNWFEDSANRCDSSFTPLNNTGQFIGRARRWVDSYEITDDCTQTCPSGGEYKDPEQVPGGFSCFENVPVVEAQPKWIYREEADSFWFWGTRYYCDDGSLTLINVSGSRGCYESVESEEPLTGWIFREQDSNNTCSAGYTRLVFGTWASEDACYEQVTDPEFGEGASEWIDYGDPVEVCSTTAVPGTWQPLDTENDPPHVDCAEDVNSNNPGNGSEVGSPGNGYPQTNVVTGNEYGPNPDDSVVWGTQGYTFYTSHYLDYLNDDSLIVQRTRISMAQEVVGNIIEATPGVDFGLMEFNSRQGGRIVQRIIEDMDERTVAGDDIGAGEKSARDNLIDLVNSTTAGGYTPLCESMWEVHQYLSGGSLTFAKSTSGSDDPLLRDTLAESGQDYLSPTTDCAAIYIILMTDGFPFADGNANDRVKLLVQMEEDEDCGFYPNDSGENVENCLPELTAYMASTDLDGDATNAAQVAETYTIGFLSQQQLLEDAATVENGYYYAEDIQGLTDAFTGALLSILTDRTTFTSPAVAVDTFSRTESRDDVFYAMFEPSAFADWSGNIKKLRLEISDDGAVLVDADGEPALDASSGEFLEGTRTFWSSGDDSGNVRQGGVGEVLIETDPASRTVLIDTGTGSDVLQSFNTTNVTMESMGVGSIGQLYSLFGAQTEDNFSKQIAWGQGYDAFNPDRATQARTWILGDILHSQPLIVNYGSINGHSTENPDQRILVGTNAGFIHQFDNEDGSEDWAFIPKELVHQLDDRRRNQKIDDNIYGMDLTGVAYTEDVGRDGSLDYTAGDKAWVFFGMRRGGISYYALDISNPNADPVHKWRIGQDVSGFEEMGQTWSEPVVARIPGYRDYDGKLKPVLIMGAGYDTNKDSAGVGKADSVGRGIFIVDADDGSLVWSVTGRGQDDDKHLF